MNKDQQEQRKEQSNARNESLEDQIAQLKSALEESQMKAKERVKHKNQSLKEMQDTLTTLTAEMADLRREKNQLTTRLTEEIQRREDDYQIHERSLRQTEDRLSKERITDIKAIEDEMNQTIQQLEVEIESLKTRVDDDSSPIHVDASNEHSKILEMEESLRRSKEKEVSLINQNMKMKQKIQDMQEQKARERPPVISVAMNDEDRDIGDDRVMSSKRLPTYYTERQRPGVIHFVGNAWKKLFRRKKL